jgi:hypothetical protein
MWVMGPHAKEKDGTSVRPRARIKMNAILWTTGLMNMQDKNLRPKQPDMDLMLTPERGPVKRKIPEKANGKEGGGSTHSLMRSSCSSSWGLMWIMTSPTL